MRRKVTIPSDITYGYRDFFGGPVGGVVGNPAWDDDDDSSYADLYGSCHPDASLTDVATGVVQATDLSRLPSDRANVSVYAWLRCQAITSTGFEAPMRVDLVAPVGRESRCDGTEVPPGGAPAWLQVGPMPFDTQGEFDGFVDAVSAGTLEVHVNMFPIQPPSGDFVYPGIRVTEAYLMIETPGTVAAPCRLIRDDDLGVGGARIYPPPRSQQRSSRGVGYY